MAQKIARIKKKRKRGQAPSFLVKTETIWHDVLLNWEA
jgi:hypothetical protein